jgi:uncharacterized protein (DUF1501 family)
VTAGKPPDADVLSSRHLAIGTRHAIGVDRDHRRGRIARRFREKTGTFEWAGLGRDGRWFMIPAAAFLVLFLAYPGTAGTDHGTGTVALLAGGALKGGRIIADWQRACRRASIASRPTSLPADWQSCAAVARS